MRLTFSNSEEETAIEVTGDVQIVGSELRYLGGSEEVIARFGVLFGLWYVPIRDDHYERVVIER